MRSMQEVGHARGRPQAGLQGLRRPQEGGWPDGWSCCEAMTRYIQANLNRCWAVQKLLQQSVAERGVGLLLLNEYTRPPVSPVGWAASAVGTSAVSFTVAACCVAEESGQGPGFGWFRFGRVQLLLDAQLPPGGVHPVPGRPRGSNPRRRGLRGNSCRREGL